MAIDPDCFAPGFKDRLTDLNKIHRELKPSPNAPGSVLVAGDPERINMRATDEAGGIKEKFENLDNCYFKILFGRWKFHFITQILELFKYHESIVDHFNNFADKINVEPIPYRAA